MMVIDSVESMRCANELLVCLVDILLVLVVGSVHLLEELQVVAELFGEPQWR